MAGSTFSVLRISVFLFVNAAKIILLWVSVSCYSKTGTNDEIGEGLSLDVMVDVQVHAQYGNMYTV